MSSDLPSILAPKEYDAFVKARRDFVDAEKVYKSAEAAWHAAHLRVTQLEQAWYAAELSVIRDFDTSRLMQDELDMEEDSASK